MGPLRTGSSRRDRQRVALGIGAVLQFGPVLPPGVWADWISEALGSGPGPVVAGVAALVAEVALSARIRALRPRVGRMV
jgi:hypothetical protein